MRVNDVTTPKAATAVQPVLVPPSRDRRALSLQVRDEIRAMIEADGLRPGAQLPSEPELASRFGVARTTTREALKLLEHDGIVDVRHGRGRFVSQLATIDRPITRLESVTEMMQSRGFTVTNRVVTVNVGPASEDEARALDQPVGTEVIHLERIRLHNGDALIYSLDVVPRFAVEGPLDQIDWSGSLLELLERNGRRAVSAAAQIQAGLLPEASRRALGDTRVRKGEPWILLAQRHLDEAGRPVIYSHDYYRGDRFIFNVVRRRIE
ncbi:MAG TPA: GntR family transcriptional regulator [Propionibacteriaceae bacterium]|jgi:GntR family transcriptional regulator